MLRPWGPIRPSRTVAFRDGDTFKPLRPWVKPELITGKICMVTGANSGIGKVTAEKLAELGATVVLVCRNEDKGRKALTDIQRKSGNAALELLVADFASFDSVKSLANDYLRGHDSLHVLVNNAGVAELRHSTTVDGFETTFQVDYLSQFLLTNLPLGAHTTRKLHP